MGQCSSSRLAFAVDKKSFTGVEKSLSTNITKGEDKSEGKKTLGCSETDSNLSSTPVKIFGTSASSIEGSDVQSETTTPSSQPLSIRRDMAKAETPIASKLESGPAKSMPQSTPKKDYISKPLSTMISPFSSAQLQLHSPFGNDFYGPSSDISQLSSTSIFLEGLDTIIIPEEVDPDAPSDEEESYQRYVDETHEKQGISKWEMEPGPIRSSIGRSSSKQRSWSPPRSMIAVKCRSKHVTRPTSIVRHHPHISPPPGSAVLSPPPADPAAVDRQTLAEFNKLKIQVQLEEKAFKQSKRIQKLEDRLQDMQAYKKLLRDFEELQETVSVNSLQNQDSSTLKRRCSFDLKESDSWFYDFQSVDIVEISNMEDDDNSLYSQQSHLSLLSAASMESQRKYFAAKKHSRKTIEKIDKLEKLLIEMNERKAKQSQSKEVQNHQDFSQRDYGPHRRQEVKSSQNSVVSDYGPAKRRGSNASIISDYGTLSIKSAIPLVITMNDDEVAAVRRGSCTSQITLKSDAAHPSQSETSGLQHEDTDVSTSIPSEGLNNTTPTRNGVDKSDKKSHDAFITPKRSGSAPLAKSLVGPISTQANVAIKEHNKNVAEGLDPYNCQSGKTSKRNGLQEQRAPRWRTFLETSPTRVKDQCDIDPTTSKTGIYQQEPISCIHAMSKEEFLKMADDQFEDLKLISISPQVNGLNEDDVPLQGRKLNFEGVVTTS